MRILIVFLLMVSGAYAQCPNDVCDDAIAVEQQTPTDFCNYDCNEDYDLIGGNWIYPQFPCSYMNYDMWFVIEVEVGGMIEFYVDSDYSIEAVDEGNFGPLEGITLELYSGSCGFLEFVTGTNCYWMNDANVCCFGAYDPSRQGWYFTVELVPGTYYVNIDGFGYSEGCGEWWWSEPYFLDLGVIERPVVGTIQEMLYNVLGQRIK